MGHGVWALQTHNFTGTKKLWEMGRELSSGTPGRSGLIQRIP